MQPIDQRKFNEMVANCERVLNDHQQRIAALEAKLSARTPAKKKAPEKTVSATV
jgi:hypothetical protein